MLSKIRRLLLDSGLVSEKQWAAASEVPGSQVEALLALGNVAEEDLLALLGGASGVPPVDLHRVSPDAEALATLSREVCEEHGILPLTKNGRSLSIVVSDPFDVLLMDDLRHLTGCEIRKVLSHPALIRSLTESLFQGDRQQVDDLLCEMEADTLNLEVQMREDSADLEDSGACGDDAPAVKLVNLILLQALREQASDIHVEPGEHQLRVRIRVDGRMRVLMTPPKAYQAALISRLKILAQLDIAERFRPQDGKFQIRHEGRSIDFRVSVLPVVGGEKAVLRILDAGAMSMELDAMGFEDCCLADIRRAIHAPHGMLLVTGPTGSGKSTTLYGCVREVATVEANVVTVEDPVEYRMEGVNQVPVNPQRGLTFADALRSILRQDPDIVLVGEIRDRETADIAVKAALTGHLVLSTLHTNDAASTVTRLVDMGVDPFLVSSSLLCVGAQRLARRICQSCRIPHTDPPPERLLAAGFLEQELDEAQLFRANQEGCPRCTEGYRGRFPILETLALDATLKRMVVEGRSVAEIRSEAAAQGALSLRRVGILNVLRGVTSLEEVLRVTLGDREDPRNT
ncbi:MAG: ATPase, T2SS/T4P/T4SS family [Planctomycetota bacterium]|nr:ATPase, T2SS/T4P/T4SS family [Planctomycetota bacterium]MDP6955869.1 ATPase, T2SS/T4P/T4SS family [Planctomycetota bacterium]